ncbi:MAG: hypothetical protein ACI4TU_11565, partial [Candidatus Cryptobacteroides sp.]
LFVQSSPAVFWTLYLVCGLSDVPDGAIARRTRTSSRLGERALRPSTLLQTKPPEFCCSCCQ